jgi:hypothetical protein
MSRLTKSPLVKKSDFDVMKIDELKAVVHALNIRVPSGKITKDVLREMLTNYIDNDEQISACVKNEMLKISGESRMAAVTTTVSRGTAATLGLDGGSSSRASEPPMPSARAPPARPMLLAAAPTRPPMPSAAAPTQPIMIDDLVMDEIVNRVIQRLKGMQIDIMNQMFKQE